MMDQSALRVNLKREIDESYDIVIGENLFPRIANHLREKKQAFRYAIITDSNVRPLYAGWLETCLSEQGLEAKIFSFQAGEESKTVDTWYRLSKEIEGAGYGRDSLILALGGGVTGDLAGFVAATYDRKIPFIQIPTTVLAQADSSVGGKVGVNSPYGKNRIGVIYQPRVVFIDVRTLRTLPDTEVSNGLAETIKHAVIGDDLFFEYLEDQMDSFFMQHNADIRDLAFRDIAKHNCRIKKEIVQIDPHENGLRRILNFGHTIGHPIEVLTNYSIPHGSALSIGMMAEGRISRDSGFFPQSDLDRLERLFERAGLPVKIPDNISNEEIMDLAAMDKKAIDVDFLIKAGAYSHVVEAGGFLFITGMDPMDMEKGLIIMDDIDKATELILENMKRLLKSVGSSMDKAVKVTIFMKDMADFQKMNAVYARYFPENAPARTCVAVKEVPGNFQLKIEAIAIK